MSNNLNDYSIEELEKAIKLKKMQKKIKPLSNPDFSELVETVKEGVEYQLKNGEEMKDFEHWCFESALKAVYGQDIFDKLYKN